MRTFISILLIGLLGFLGCSGSNDETSTFKGEAVPVAPFGIIGTPSPTYEWTPVSGATRYRLNVQDTNQEFTTQDTGETSIINEWYTAEEAGCASEDGLCKATPDAEVIGKNEFQVQACANDECGLWSEQLNFEFTAMNTPRFTDNGDDTVTDNYTNLIWTKNANLCGRELWQDAMDYSSSLTHAGRSDWRLPSILELRSLIDPRQFNPALPPGHPFLDVQSLNYWTRSTYMSTPQRVWIVDMHWGSWGQSPMRDWTSYVWPVRSGD